MSQDIKTSVEQYIANCNVSVAPYLLGEVTRDKWVCDHWKVTIKNKGNVSEVFDYYTGVGLRKPAKGAPPAPKCMKRTIAYVDWEKLNLKPVNPHPADILYCLLSDAEAIDMSFSNWCDSFGYDEDSRKAFDTYTQCGNIGKQIRKVFSHKQVVELRQMLQNY